jgi:hypothetical protein
MKCARRRTALEDALRASAAPALGAKLVELETWLGQVSGLHFTEDLLRAMTAVRAGVKRLAAAQLDPALVDDAGAAVLLAEVEAALPPPHVLAAHWR